MTPDEEQQRIVREIRSHWTGGFGTRYNHARGIALQLIDIAADLEEARRHVRERHGAEAVMLATTASLRDSLRKKLISFDEAKEILMGGGRPSIILFGTAWGIAEDVLESADFILPPLPGREGYNHLSVRTAAAIVVDRLFGR